MTHPPDAYRRVGRALDDPGRRARPHRWQARRHAPRLRDLADVLHPVRPFPRGRSELPDQVVEHVAKQVQVPASELGFYEWSGSTIEYHRNQIRTHLGFRTCTTADATKVTVWLAENVAHAERRPERVREELLKHLREERIEPPTDAARRPGRSGVGQAAQARRPARADAAVLAARPALRRGTAGRRQATGAERGCRAAGQPCTIPAV
ncbi:DUF4158 domain-containing protein [Actinoallomurus purpureus]|uniref:DUF4158 domain-containing protein n=1 Tax=Actinoallomurus purpureus TaxID=478114 RepID=UPI003556FC06